MAIVLRDITDRRRAEEAMHEAEERFRSAFEQAPIGIALVSIESDRAGCFLRVDRALREITGCDDGDLVGRPVGEILDPDGSTTRTGATSPGCWQASIRATRPRPGCATAGAGF